MAIRTQTPPPGYDRVDVLPSLSSEGEAVNGKAFWTYVILTIGVALFLGVAAISALVSLVG
jgi:hypothetical protein